MLFRIMRIADEKHARLWINHDKSSSDARRHTPKFYDWPMGHSFPASNFRVWQVETSPKVWSVQGCTRR